MRIALLTLTTAVIALCSIGCEKRITEASARPTRSLETQTIAANFSAAAMTGPACDAPCN